MIPGEFSRSRAVSTKARYTAMHKNKIRGGEKLERLGAGGGKERWRRKGKNVSDSMCERRTRGTVKMVPVSDFNYRF